VDETRDVGTGDHGSEGAGRPHRASPLRQGAAMNDRLHPLHARQVVDELERRIVRADTASAKTAAYDCQP
jgi:hypothetical protein